MSGRREETTWSCTLARVSRGVAQRQASRPFSRTAHGGAASAMNNGRTTDERTTTWQHFDQPRLSCTVRQARITPQPLQQPPNPAQASSVTAAATSSSLVAAHPAIGRDTAAGARLQGVRPLPTRELSVSVTFTVCDPHSAVVVGPSIVLEEIDIIALVLAAQQEATHGPSMTAVTRPGMVGLRYRDLSDPTKWRRCQLFFERPQDTETFLSLIRTDTYIIRLPAVEPPDAAGLSSAPLTAMPATSAPCSHSGSRSDSGRSASAEPMANAAAAFIAEQGGGLPSQAAEAHSDVEPWLRQACGLLLTDESSLDRALLVLAEEMALPP